MIYFTPKPDLLFLLKADLDLVLDRKTDEIENEALSKKDFTMRIKICRKEAKESEYWLTLTDTEGKPPLEKE